MPRELSLITISLFNMSNKFEAYEAIQFLTKLLTIRYHIYKFLIYLIGERGLERNYRGYNS